MTQFTQHPLSAAFPSMPGHEVDSLAKDILEHGQREPGVIFEGQILDGWHRYRACEIASELSSAVQFRFVEFPAGGDPVAFVKSRNLHRRHMSDSQRAASVVACSKWAPAGNPDLPSGRRRSNPALSAGLEKGATPAPSTTAQMAAEADVSARTINHAKTAHAAGLGDAVVEGKVSARRAAEIVRADPKVGKKIASGKVTADQVIEKAKPLPKILPRPEAAKPEPPAPKPPSAAELKREQKAADRIRELEARVAELEAELAESRDLAVQLAEDLEGIMKSGEGRDEAAREITRLNGVVRVVQSQRDQIMTTSSEQVKEIKRLQRKVERLEKGPAR